MAMGKLFSTLQFRNLTLTFLFSGGPIQITHSDASCVFDIVGVTSSGSFKCGSKVPSTYTRVASFLDWIEEKVWP